MEAKPFAVTTRSFHDSYIIVWCHRRRLIFSLKREVHQLSSAYNRMIFQGYCCKVYVEMLSIVQYVLQRFLDVNRKLGMSSSVFHIPERSQQAFAVDFYKTSSLNFAFGLEMEFLVQGDSDIITLIFTVNSNKAYVGTGYNKALKGWNFRILTICPWN